MNSLTLNGIEIFVDEVGKYIQINDISDKDLSAIWESLREGFLGYELMLCFRDIDAPITALSEIGAEVLEDCIKLQVTPSDFSFCESSDVTLLRKADFTTFATLHDTTNPDCFWTSERILSNVDIWRIFTLRKDNDIIGYSTVMIDQRDSAIGEIFFIEADNHFHRKALLSAASQSAFENDKSTVIYMVDRANTNIYNVAIEVGFKEVGYYIGYQIKCIQ